MNYEQLKKDAHTLYLRGDMSQKMAVSIMGLKPSKRWIVQKCHEGIAALVAAMLKERK